MSQRKNRSGYLFILPALAVIIVFRFYPIIQAIRMSFFKWGMAGPLQVIGLRNFSRLLADTKFYQSLGNTFWYLVFVVPLTIILSVLFAQLLNQKISGRGIYRTLYYLPVVTSIVAVSVVWKWIFNPDRGILNAIFSFFGADGLKWLNDARGIFEIVLTPLNLTPSGFLSGPSIALCALIIMAVWHNIGYCVIIAS